MIYLPSCNPDDLFIEQRSGKWFVFERDRLGWLDEADTMQEINAKLREARQLVAVYRALTA